MSEHSYQPFLKITETFVTSRNLKCIKEILQFPEEEHVTKNKRDLIPELRMSKWVQVYTEDYSFPQDDDTRNVFSHLFDRYMSQIYVYDFHYFD